MRAGQTIVQPTTLNIFTNLMEEGIPFSFSRWNDAHWRMILGITEGRTGDGHKYSKEIGDDLREVLLSRPGYMLGIQGLSLRGSLGKKVGPWIESAGLSDLNWFDADVFHHASRDGITDSLISLLMGRKIVLVGPKHMGSLPFVWKFIPIPQTDTYYVKNRIGEQLAEILGKEEPRIISISAGWTANLLISDLYEAFGDRHTFIDFGSVWDPYVGVYSRSYMKEDTFRVCDLEKQ